MKQAIENMQSLDSLGASPLLTITPALKRTSVAEAVIMTTLSTAGQEFAFAHGRAALTQRLREECITPADRARTVRFDWHFSDPAREPPDLATPATRPTLPDVIGRAERGLERVLYLYINDSLAWFDGHFPNDPILPAVVQIDWVIHFGTDYSLQDSFDRNCFTGLSRLKFRSAIVPDTVLRLTLSATGDSLQFAYESRDGLHSEGKIRFHGNSNQG